MIILGDFFIDVSGLLDLFGTKLVDGVTPVTPWVTGKIGLDKNETEETLRIFIYKDQIQITYFNTEAYFRDIRPYMKKAYLESLEFFLDLWEADLVGNIQEACLAFPAAYAQKVFDDITLTQASFFPVPHNLDPVGLRLILTAPIEASIVNDSLYILRYTSAFDIPNDTVTIYSIELFDIPKNIDLIKIVKRQDNTLLAVAEIISYTPPEIQVKNVIAKNPFSVLKEDEVLLFPVQKTQSLSGSILTKLIDAGVIRR